MKRNIAVGFVTGRKHFQNVLKSYINNWLEHGLIQDDEIRLHLFILYDLKYHGTEISDYKKIPPELVNMVDSINFYGAGEIANEVAILKSTGKIIEGDARLLFGEGYAKKRNVVTYFAIKNKMDRLIFIDDDEYPLATLKNEYGKLVWMGQSIVGTHLKYIADADITHGHHCGYISPIPYIDFNEVLTENDFRYFIEAISNDIISWEKIRTLIADNKGVTYANSDIINNSLISEVKEENGLKFISGANLCFNLDNTEHLPPFYNPPGARGEDTFMSTSLSKLKVVKVPCYTFHDGFLMYNNLLNGVLPLSLEAMDRITPVILKRFVNATVGWIRYKPLLVYITKRGEYENTMKDMLWKLNNTIPKLCRYFSTNEFERILQEFLFYRKNVLKHFNDFEATKDAWAKLMKMMN
jgi:hypothetical protein